MSQLAFNLEMPAPVVPNDPREEKLCAYLCAANPPQPIDDTWTVSRLHQYWGELCRRADRIGACLGVKVRRLEAKLKATTGRVDRANVKRELQYWHGLAETCQGGAECEYYDHFSDYLDAHHLDDDQKETFSETAQLRPGIEWCWDMTLGQLRHDLFNS